MKPVHNYMGLDGFIWWWGVVENRNDPLKLGRAQVRIYTWHTEDKTLIPSQDLPWAHPILPLNNSAPIAPKEGDWVMGFFMDGRDAQFPVMMGVVPGIPEMTPPISEGFSDQRTPTQLQSAPRPPENRTYETDGTGIKLTETESAERYPNVLNQPTTPALARNENLDGTFIEIRKETRVTDVPVANSEQTWSEPETAYAAVYPYNKVTQTESGHIFELDDTFGAERIQLAHRAGSFEEYYPDGSKVTKVVKDNYQVIMGSDNVLIMGVCNVTINGKARLYIKSDYEVEVDGNLNTKVKGDINTVAEGKLNISALGTATVDSAGNMVFTAPRIDLNP
jgi:hypothetical protein